MITRADKIAVFGTKYYRRFSTHTTTFVGVITEFTDRQFYLLIRASENVLTRERIITSVDKSY